MIKTLVTKYGGKNSTVPDLRFLLICLLGFAGFLRIDKLLDVKLKHMKYEISQLCFSVFVASTSYLWGKGRL